MKRIAEFQKVSLPVFSACCGESSLIGSDGQVLEAYKSIRLPRRATTGSAGYDFFLPFAAELPPGGSLSVPTGIRVRIDAGWVLMIFPKSGLGFRYRLQLDNTVGIVDQDYYGAENEGHIIIRITNDSKSDTMVSLERGKAFAQGIFVEYGIAAGDETKGTRTGGFGSTGV